MYQADVNNKKFQNRHRYLSPHVVSRAYRAPELIYTEKEYDQSIDMWSIGCCLAEMMHCSQTQMKKFFDLSKGDFKKKVIEQYIEQKFLFNGNSCFPLSPDEYNKGGFVDHHYEDITTTMNPGDQIIKIN